MNLLRSISAHKACLLIEHAFTDQNTRESFWERKTAPVCPDTPLLKQAHTHTHSQLFIAPYTNSLKSNTTHSLSACAEKSAINRKWHCQRKKEKERVKEKLLCESAVCSCQLSRCVQGSSWERGERCSPRVKRRELRGFSRIPFHLNLSKVIKANGAIVLAENIQWFYSERSSLCLCVCETESD